MSRRLTWVIISLVVVPGAPLWSGGDSLVREIDLRKKKGGPAGNYVVFCARKGVPGHAFIVLGKDDAKAMLCSVEAFGLYPKNSSPAALFRSVPGEIADEAVRGKGAFTSAIRLIAKVSPGQFDSVDKIRKEWAKKGNFKLIEHDCVTFTAEVANKLGLKVPDRVRYKLPVSFMRALAEMNGK